MRTRNESAVSQVAELKDGESFCRAKFIPANSISAENIYRAKRELMGILSPVLSRARERNPGNYRMSGIHSFTKDFDVVVAVVITRIDDDL
jgi:hypothetical protein